MTPQEQIEAFIRQASADLFTGGKPRSKAAAARRFRCESMSAVISGDDCARRYTRANGKKRLSQTFDAGCVGCALGEARSGLLGVTSESVEADDRVMRARRARGLERRGNRRIEKVNRGLEEIAERARRSKPKKAKRRAAPVLRLVGEEPKPSKSRRQGRTARPPAPWVRGLDLSSRIDKVGLARRLGLPHQEVCHEIARLRKSMSIKVTDEPRKPTTGREMLDGAWFIEADLGPVLGELWPCPSRQIERWRDTGCIETRRTARGQHNDHRLTPKGVDDLRDMITNKWKTADGIRLNRRAQLEPMEKEGRLRVRRGRSNRTLILYLDNSAEADIKAGAYMASVYGVPSGTGRPLMPSVAKRLKAYRGRMFRAGILDRTGSTSSSQWWVIDEGRFAAFVEEKGLAGTLADIEASEPMPGRGMGWIPPRWVERIESRSPGVLGVWMRQSLVVRVNGFWWSLGAGELFAAVRKIGLDPNGA